MKKKTHAMGIHKPSLASTYMEHDSPSPDWIHYSWASLVALIVKNLPAMKETWVRSLGWEDPLEEGMATYSSILVWRIPMDREVWWATVHGAAQKSHMTEVT